MERARDPAAKLTRRNRLLYAAAELFSATPYDDLTVAEIARHAGVAKGTFYLYFTTKDELFLRLVEAELAAWMTALGACLDAAEGPEQVAAVIAAETGHRTELLRLLTVLHACVEPRVGATALEASRLAVANAMAPVATRLEAAVPTLGPGAGGAVLRCLVALIVGLFPASRPTSVMGVGGGALAPTLERALAAWLRAW